MNENSEVTPDGLRERFYEWIKRIKKAEGINSATLADRAGISRSTVSRYETRTVFGLPDMQTIEKIQTAFPLVPFLAGQPNNAAASIANGNGDMSDDVLSLDQVQLLDGRNCNQYQVSSAALKPLGIHRGDILLATSELSPASADLVIIDTVDQPQRPGRLTVARYWKSSGVELLCSNLNTPPRLADGSSSKIRAVVVEVRRRIR